MLSRAAERVYWSGRYLERAENTARIVQQYSHLFLDLPPEVGVEWRELVRIFGVDKAFRDSDKGDDEVAVLEYLLAEPRSACSLAYSVAMARENMRNTRSLLPQESWESVNELYRYTREKLALAAVGENRFDVLADCIGRCQQIHGILSGTMSHHSPHHFLTLGRQIERADMTSRIIDVAASYLRQNERLVRRYGSTLWTNVLKSVSGFQMYRQYCQPQVHGVRVIDFLLRDAAFPRALKACMQTAAASVAALPHSESTTATLAEVERTLDATTVEGLDATGISAQLDGLQKQLGVAHQAIADSWFLHRDSS